MSRSLYQITPLTIKSLLIVLNSYSCFSKMIAFCFIIISIVWSFKYSSFQFSLKINDKKINNNKLLHAYDGSRVESFYKNPKVDPRKTYLLDYIHRIATNLSMPVSYIKFKEISKELCDIGEVGRAVGLIPYMLSRNITIPAVFMTSLINSTRSWNDTFALFNLMDKINIPKNLGIYCVTITSLTDNTIPNQLHLLTNIFREAESSGLQLTCYYMAAKINALNSCKQYSKAIQTYHALKFYQIKTAHYSMMYDTLLALLNSCIETNEWLKSFEILLYFNNIGLNINEKHIQMIITCLSNANQFQIACDLYDTFITNQNIMKRMELIYEQYETVSINNNENKNKTNEKHNNDNNEFNNNRMKGKIFIKNRKIIYNSMIIACKNEINSKKIEIKKQTINELQNCYDNYKNDNKNTENDIIMKDNQLNECLINVLVAKIKENSLKNQLIIL